MGQTYNGMYHFCPHSFRLNSITWPKEKRKKKKTGECSPALHTEGKRNGEQIAAPATAVKIKLTHS